MGRKTGRGVVIGADHLHSICGASDGGWDGLGGDIRDEATVGDAELDESVGELA